MKRSIITTLLALLLLLAGCSAPTTTTTADHSCRPLPAGNGPLVYVAIGASDAVGYGANCAVSDGYVPLLGQKMPAGTKVVNLGIAGVTAGQAINDELPYALAAKPNTITVWLAGNDFRAMDNGDLTLAQYTQQLDTLLSKLHAALPHARIFVGNLPQLSQLPYFQHGKTPLTTIATENLQWNAAIATVTTKDSAILVDLFHTDIASHAEYIFADGFHPSTLGYRQLALAFWAVILQHGGVTA